MEKNSMMIIDGNSILFRAFFAMPPFKNKDGLVTNAVYGFLNMMYKIIEDYNPKYLCVAFDAKGPTFRHKKFKDYKIQRAKAPDDLIPQFALIREIIKLHGLEYIEVQGFEADDIAGTMAKYCSEKSLKTYLVTSDKDYLQLIDENVHVLLTKKGVSLMKEMDLEAMEEEYEMTPTQFIDLKALMGDASDNIPGVAGVGIKTGIKLLKEYETLENLYEHVDELKGKLKEKIENDKMNAFLSKELATIITDMPLEFELEDYVLKKFNYKALESEFEYLNYSRLLIKLKEVNKCIDVENNSACISEKTEETSEKEIEKTSEDKVFNSEGIIFIKNLGDSYTDMLGTVKNSDKMYFKFAFDGKRAMFSEAFGIFIYANEYNFYVDLRDIKDQFFNDFKEIFENENIKKCGHHLKEEIIYLLKRNIELNNIYFDSAIAMYILKAENYNNKIDSIAYEYLNKEIPNIVDYIGKGKKEKIFSEIEEERVIEYLFNTINTVEKSENKLEEELRKLESWNIFHNIELPLVVVLADMEFRGFEMEDDVLQSLKTKFVKDLLVTETEIYELCGKKFNLNSPKQLGVVLFEDLGLPAKKKTKTGYSTNIEVLESLKKEHVVIEKIIEYRKLTKLVSTYIEGLSVAIANDGRIHSILNQTITATGRISSRNPNLQNIPTKTKRGREIRKAFIAKNGCKLLDADYSQIELRVLAELSGEIKLIEAFKNGADIHTKTASEVFKLPVEDVTKELRSRAKAVNFGIIYGISQFGLSKDLGISRSEAKEYIENYLSSYKNIDNYMKLLVAEAKTTFTSETYFGRKRHIVELESRNFNIRAAGERIALNTPIQGTAADIIKIAMINVYNRLKTENLKAKLIMQIHDELIIEAPEEEVERASLILREEMESVVPNFTVEMKVDLNIGKSWEEAK